MKFNSIFIIVLLIAFFKTGVTPISMDRQVHLIESLEKNISIQALGNMVWPTCFTYYLFPALLRVDTLLKFNLWIGALLLTYFVVVYALAKSFADNLRSAIFLLLNLGGTALTVILYGWGNYDLLFILFSTWLVYAESYWAIIILGLLFSFSHPEQGFVSASCYLAYEILMNFRLILTAVQKAVANGKLAVGSSVRPVIKAAIIFVIVSSVFLGMYLSGLRSRTAILLPYARVSAAGFFPAWPIAIYSFYSTAWVLVFLSCFMAKGAIRFLLFAVLFLLPFFPTLITLDQTRVFGCASQLVLLSHARRFLQDDSFMDQLFFGRKIKDVLLIGTCALFLFAPAIYYRGDTGSVWLPYQYLKESAVKLQQ